MSMLLDSFTGVGSPAGVNFSGTSTNYLSKASMTGQADSKKGVLNLWWRAESVANNDKIFGNIDTGAGLRLYFDASSRLNFYAGASGAASTAAWKASGTGGGGGGTSLGGWQHLLLAWDFGLATASGKRVLGYHNDASVFTIDSDADADFSVDLTTSAGWTIGEIFTGTLGEIWFSPTWLDLTDVLTRRKFFSADGRPVSLGATGQLPLGSQPLLYLKGPSSNIAANLGSGGNFTVNGTLTDSAVGLAAGL